MERVFLLVEDTPDDERLVELALQTLRTPFALVTVRNGEEALDYVFRAGRFAKRQRLGDPSLILLDVKLPGLSGLEVLRRIRATVESSILPVVMFSARTDPTTIAEAYSLGANSYVVKPPATPDFLDAVSAIGEYWLGANLTHLELAAV